METEELLKSLEEEANLAIDKASQVQEVNEAKAQFLGKKSKLNALMATMRDLSAEGRKELGEKINSFKTNLENKVREKIASLEEAKINAMLASQEIDVTLPGKEIPEGNLHPLTKIYSEIEEICSSMGFKVADGPEVECDLYNFEMLNLPKGHPAREMQDSYYITENMLLRTQTSPVQIRTLLAAKGEPVKIICPGKVYRRDNDDATHSHQFMQCEGLVVGPNVTMADLKGTLQTIFRKLFGEDIKVRFRPSFFPFTEPSVEVDFSCFKCHGAGCPLCKQNGWIEVLGAGMVHPNVLKMAGYDPEKMQGFAFGIGIERIAMLKYGIDDIRNFYNDDVRFLKQF